MFKIYITNEDTGVVIFGPNQDNQLKVFEESKKYNILYKSPKAYNKSHPETGPRNTLIIFELA
jgi:hypothetical protein